MGMLMGEHDSRTALGRLAVIFAIAAMTAGCFQPLYGGGTTVGGTGVRAALSAIEIEPIPAPDGSSEARLAVQIRNELLFNFTGGGALSSPTHVLKVQIAGTPTVVGIDRTTTQPTIENYRLTATYILTEIATKAPVVRGTAVTTVSFDPAGTQRFARLSGAHDAERRAAKVVSEHITTRLASYFISGS
jgi:LPS-assembly lipoprotein